MFPNETPIPGPKGKTVAKKKANTNPPKSDTLDAQYLGCLFSVIRITMGIKHEDVLQLFGTKTYSSVAGKALVSPLTMRERKNCDKFQAIPKLEKLMNRNGFGDVLRQYEKGEDLDPSLFDQGLCDIIRETAHCSAYSSQHRIAMRLEKVLEYFKVKPTAKKRRAEKEIPAELQDQLEPIEVANIHEAVAQERLLQRKDIAKRWANLSNTQRKSLIGNDIRLVVHQTKTVEQLWTAAAKGLAARIAPKSTKKHREVLQDAVRAEGIDINGEKLPSTPLARRAFFMLRNDGSVPT